MLFQIVQILYWLALSTWFGGVLFIAIAAPIIFRTVRESRLILPEVLSVNLESQHATLLAGSIVGKLLARLTQVELLCGGILLFALIAQFFLIDLTGDNLRAAQLRCVLYLAAMATVLYDWRVIWPRIWKYRQEYIDNADQPDIANPAKERFDQEHHRSVTLLSIVLFLLLGIILFSANILPRKAEPLIIAPAAALIDIHHVSSHLEKTA